MRVEDTNPIDKVKRMVQEKIPAERVGAILRFVSQYYQSAAVEDLCSYSSSDLYGALLSFWNFINQRQAGEIKVRVYNPSFELHEWRSKYTIVEIICTDMPFLVDTARMEVNRLGYTVHYSIHCGGMRFKRDAHHHILDVLPIDAPAEEMASIEAPIYMEIDRIIDANQQKQLRNNLLRVLQDVDLAVVDWPAMRRQVSSCIQTLFESSMPDAQESARFLTWLVEDHFTFLGYREYDLVAQGDDKVLLPVPESGLGVLRHTDTASTVRSLSHMTDTARELMLGPNALILAKTNTLSTVHRPVYTDYVGIKRFDADGQLCGECRVVGLYTSAAYNSNPKDVPLLDNKVQRILRSSQLPATGHASKALVNIIETFPRDDLLQGHVEELTAMCIGILHLQERQRIRLFVRWDTQGRFVSCLVYVPNDRFNTDLRRRIQRILAQSFKSKEMSFSTHLSDSPLARIHFIIRIDKYIEDVDVTGIERKIVAVSREWRDELKDNLIEYYGEELGNLHYLKYMDAFRAGYQETFSPRTTVHDIEHFEGLSESHTFSTSLYQPLDESSDILHLKLYRLEKKTPLSDIMPMLENMGLRVIRQRPFKATTNNGVVIRINVFEMMHHLGDHFELDDVRKYFDEAFLRIWGGEAEDDPLNRLILAAKISWRAVVMLRTYSRYLRQIRLPFSQDYIADAFLRHSPLIQTLVKLFLARFDPEQTHRESLLTALNEKLLAELDNIDNVDDDRILRRMHDLVQATERTNYFQRLVDGSNKPWIALKFNPKKIPDLPLPLPLHEIFVYATDFEGVHLRGHKVARGGLRWSDRREDFRTEILGLMKTQQVKNAVIVPLGAKGGFVAKRMPKTTDREMFYKEGVRRYQMFIKGLLDLTDNRVDDQVVPPPKVLRYDEDDPYLVVAADKGTATFSDIANCISKEYRFWLGDAFASGGSAGYDHKKMGITARGAWESVKRHFREFGHDIQQQDFTVIGIGDMSGDVFGNGMLLSEHIRLVAAFNHLHIFIDPDPDPITSYAERVRLFKLSRSTWESYNTELISAGGGIFSRTAKYIELTPEIKALTGLNVDRLRPNALIHALLMARADLLWNGGIGTYVKASTESHAEVGDRANDAVRVDANALRCRVIGEGGNLGLTQLARVEYALAGGSIYTDSVDNSGGVNCSDREVNIKILLGKVIENGDLTLKQRDELLESMTDEVAELVLSDNYAQTFALSKARRYAFSSLDLTARYIIELERSVKLNRELEFLPSQETLLERKSQGVGLVAPEFALLFGYSKIAMKGELLHSSVVENSDFNDVIVHYFPKPLQERFHNEILQHSLRCEIIATQLANNIINEVGMTFSQRLREETGASLPEIVCAYYAAKKIFAIDTAWQAVYQLDNHVVPDVQLEIVYNSARLLRRSVRWLLKNNKKQLNIQQLVARYAGHVKQILEMLKTGEIIEVAPLLEQGVIAGVEAGLPEELAKQVTCYQVLFPALDIIEAAQQSPYLLSEIVKLYFYLGVRLDLAWFKEQINAHAVENHWDALARAAIRDDVEWLQGRLSISILSYSEDANDYQASYAAWLECHAAMVSRWQLVVTELRSVNVHDFTMFFVALRELFADLTDVSQITLN